jgi:hypothetical protein
MIRLYAEVRAETGVWQHEGPYPLADTLAVSGWLARQDRPVRRIRLFAGTDPIPYPEEAL